MNKLSGYFLLAFLICSFHLEAQKIETELMKHIDILSSKNMHGRGYVGGGREIAAGYIVDKFKEYKLQPAAKDNSFTQAYDFPVNTFPGKMYLKINRDSLKPGNDFVIDPSSSSLKAKDLSVKTINLGKIKDSAALLETLSTLDTGYAIYFKNLDDLCEKLEMRKDQFISQLPAGCYIIAGDELLSWSVSRVRNPATVFYVKDLPRKVKRVSVNVNSEFIDASRSENIIGQVPGEVKDTFIVITTHYDHLGMMGDKVFFPGASDNASGTAMFLYLSYYFSVYPQHYSMLFIAFAGEEAGLMGSEFYVWKPIVPLSNMKFLINIDIMGDAARGISVVNAPKVPHDFDLLRRLNEQGRFLPQVKSKEEAANSDHYYFSEAGVPCFTLFSNGRNGHFHDLLDTKEDISLKNIDRVRNLLVNFVKELGMK